MLGTMDALTLLSFVSLSLVVFRMAVRRWLSDTKLPPGPRGGFLLGVKNRLPKSEPWKMYAEWSQDFHDPVISFRVYKRHIVVLNSAEAISDLLGRKADIYSDRPMSWMYNVVCGRGKAIFNISASDPRHKQYRKLLQSGLGIRATRDYVPLIERESRRLVQGLIQTPEQLITHIQRNSAAVIMKVAFGYNVTDDDPFIKVAEEASNISGWATQPGRWFVDHHPIIRFLPSWLPWMAWKRQGLAWRERLRYLAEVPHQWLKEQMAAHKHEGCFTSRLLAPEDREKATPEEEDVIKWCAGGLYAGAGDTTVSAIISFVLLMALHPEVQVKARQELRSEFGHLSCSDTSTHAGNGEQDTIDPSHLARLPYLNAIMKEVLRCAPVGNLALPHCVTEDDVYRGYWIPRGATVIANVWAVMHDPSLYPDPFTFDPERFVAPTADRPSFNGAKKLQPDPRQWAFGFGKRACPGSHFAEVTMLYAMFNVLSRCAISLPKGAPKPEIEFTTGITSHLKQFPIVVDPL